MYFKKPSTEEPLAFESSHAMLLGITTIVTIVLGLLPDLIVKML